MIRLSLVIPTHNRAEQLLVALRSVVRQSADPASWECVVVNNASTDDTEERFAAFAAEHPGINLRMVFEPEPGVSHARNRGLSEARADLLAWIDDDERIGEHFIAAYLDFFDAYSGASVAGGRIVAEYPKGRPRWMSKYVEMPVANPMDFGPAVRPFPLGRVPGGGNMAFRRSLAMRYGGFDVALGRVGRELIGGEENDFFERLRDDLVRARRRDVAYHSARKADRRLFPPPVFQRGSEPASAGGHPPPHASDPPARNPQVGRHAAALSYHAPRAVALAAEDALADFERLVR